MKLLKKNKSNEQTEDYTNTAYLSLIKEYYYPKHVLRIGPYELAQYRTSCIC